MQKRMPFERCAGMTGLDRKLTGTGLDAAYDNTGAVADSAGCSPGSTNAAAFWPNAFRNVSTCGTACVNASGSITSQAVP